MRWPGVFAVLGGLAACTDGTGGPFDGLPLDGDFTVSLGAPVHLARDRYGIAHISANTMGDAAFVQGYVMAHDRLPQMDLLRRFAAGTQSELFGATDPAVIDSDLEMRMHRMPAFAQDAWSQLLASSDPTDRQVVALVEQFALGVNGYATDLQRGMWAIDPSLAIGFDPARFVAWSAVDSVMLGRFAGFALSWSAPVELDATELYQKLRASYDLAPATPAAVARRGISRDLVRFAPIGRQPTIDGFPNDPDDTGSRSDGSEPASPRRAPGAAPAAADPVRPVVPQVQLDSARALFGPEIHNGPLGALGPHALSARVAGSSSWAIGPAIGRGGSALLAADLQLPLANPMMFYPVHLIVADADGDPGTVDDGVDVLGIAFPGVPGVIAGSNGHVAWSATVSGHDVTDVYLEQIAPCSGGRDCVRWTDPEGTLRDVPIERITESIAIGALGAITETRMATYEVVPHHGPIVPAIDRASHALVPRTGGAALSIAYTGYRPTFELRALYNLGRARTVLDGFRAVKDFSYGGPSWTLIDREQHIGWTTQAYLPVRTPAAYSWDPLVRQDGLAPFFVLPGDGTGDWLGDRSLSPRFIPHAIDPQRGYIVTADADPVGATFDGLPLDQGVVAGDPLYAGAAYAAGLREDRITMLVEQFRDPATQMTLDDLASIQRDTHSSVGEKLAPAILDALARLDSPPVLPPDLAPYLAGLPAADRARLDRARALLARWTFATPPAATDAPDDDSAATAIFHTWMHFFIARTLEDELDAVGFDVWRLDDDQLVRIVHALLTAPRSLVTSAFTQQPILCDNYAVAGNDDSCTKAILQALVDAMTHLASPQGFGTDDTTQWRWGELHRLAIAPLMPNPALNLPAPSDPATTGFSRAGDSFTVARGDSRWRDLAPAHPRGPAQQFLAQAAPGRALTVKWSLPGGAIFDSRSPHYRDLLDRHYLTGQPFDAPYSIEQIVAAGESRWVFH